MTSLGSSATKHRAGAEHFWMTPTSRREFSLGDMNPVGVQRPVGEYLLLAEFGFRQLDGFGRADGLDFQKTLANFGLMAVLAKDILQKSHDKASHDRLLSDSIVTGSSTWFKIKASPETAIDSPQHPAPEVGFVVALWQSQLQIHPEAAAAVFFAQN
jgi:hypothetical protein